MTRILGFCPCCWPEAGTLAIVVTEHNTTRAPQIFLNMLMVAFPKRQLLKFGPQPLPELLEGQSVALPC